VSERRERDAIIARADADIDALAATLARAVAASIRRHGGETVTPLTRAMVLRDLDADLLPAVFGRSSGDETAPLYRLLLRRSRQAALAAVARSVADVRHRLRRAPGITAMLDEAV